MNDNILPNNEDKTSIENDESFHLDLLWNENELNDEKLKEDETQFGVYTITKRNLYIIYLSVILYILDIGSDIFVGIKYANERYFLYSTFTFIFIFFPSFIINYYWGYRTLELLAERGSVKYKVIYVLSTLFCITPFIQYFLNIKILLSYFNSTNDKVKQKELYEKFNLGNDLVSCQRLWETLLEGIPQIFLQIFIMFNYMECFDRYAEESKHRLIYSQLTSISTSSLGIFTIAFSWYRANRLARGWYASMTGSLFHSVVRSFPVVCRLMCIAASMSFNIYMILVLLFIYWFLSGFWYWFKLIKDVKRGAIWGTLIVFTPYCFTIKQCAIQNVVLHLTNIGFILIWALNTCYQELFVILIVCNVVFVDAIFRILHVFQVKYENRFLTKNTDNKDCNSFNAKEYFQKNVPGDI